MRTTDKPNHSTNPQNQSMNPNITPVSSQRPKDLDQANTCSPPSGDGAASTLPFVQQDSLPESGPELPPEFSPEKVAKFQACEAAIE
ncbi:MAG: hypothetical protein AAFU38_20415, partial [Bacteroidota bacterium]